MSKKSITTPIPNRSIRGVRIGDRLGIVTAIVDGFNYRSITRSTLIFCGLTTGRNNCNAALFNVVEEIGIMPPDSEPSLHKFLASSPRSVAISYIIEEEGDFPEPFQHYSFPALRHAEKPDVFIVIPDDPDYAATIPLASKTRR